MSAFAADRDGGARYWQAIREHWLLIASLVVIGVAAAVAYSMTAAERYEASADVLVTPVSANDDTYIGLSLLRESSDQSRSVLTAARLIKTPQIAEAARARLDPPQPPRDALLGAIEVQPLGQSNIVTITGNASSADRAADRANAFADALVEERTRLFQTELAAVIQRLESRMSALGPEGRDSPDAEATRQRLAELHTLVGAKDPTLQISSRAVPPATPVWPRPLLSTVAALLAALMLGIGAALALELANPRVRGDEELLLTHRLPILARVPRMTRRAVRAYLAGRVPLPGDVREAYRTLRASLAAAGPDGRFPQTIVITSAIPGEGKTMTSVNLAITIAQTGMSVVLIDGDLRRPTVATAFGVAAGRKGFASVLLGDATPAEAFTAAPGHGERLRLLLSSPEHAYLVDLIQIHDVERVLAELRLTADVVVVDSPPVTEVADALTLADAAEVVVIAARIGRTRRDKLAELRRVLAQRGIAPIGFVVTSKRRSSRHGYYYGATSRGRKRGGRDAEVEARREPAVVRAEADVGDI